MRQIDFERIFVYFDFCVENHLFLGHFSEPIFYLKNQADFALLCKNMTFLAFFVNTSHILLYKYVEFNDENYENPAQKRKKMPHVQLRSIKKSEASYLTPILCFGLCSDYPVQPFKLNLSQKTAFICHLRQTTKASKLKRRFYYRYQEMSHFR